MLDDETAALLARGCALIVGAVAPDGAPRALRGWGVEVLAADPLRLRVLVDGHDEEALDLLGRSRLVAVTVADVVTLTSAQFKGTSAGIEPAPADAAAMMEDYVSQFFDDIEATDGTPRDRLERIVPDPDGLVALIVEVDGRFDQTPGPGAGRVVGQAT